MCVFLHRKQLFLLNGREDVLEICDGKRRCGVDGEVYACVCIFIRELDRV